MKERVILILPILVFLVVVMSFLRPETNVSNAASIKRFWIVKTHTKKKFEFLICGDSRTYRAVSPDAMEDILPGLSILNFGFSSGSFSPFMLDQIENKLDFSASVKILYLGITPYSLTPKAARDGHIKQELARKKEEILEALYLDPIKQFFEPLKLTLGRTVDSVTYIQVYKKAGWVATDKIPPNPEEALPIYLKDFENNIVSEELASSLILKVREWTGRGVKVFATRPPTTKEMVKLENRLSGFEQAQFIERFRKAGGIWLEMNDDKYKSFDGSHLDIPSSIEFSKDLAVRIRLELDNSL